MGGNRFWLVWHDAEHELHKQEWTGGDCAIGRAVESGISMPTGADVECRLRWVVGGDVMLQDTAPGLMLNNEFVRRRTVLDDGDIIQLTTGIKLHYFVAQSSYDDYLNYLETTPASEEDADSSTLYEASYFEEDAAPVEATPAPLPPAPSVPSQPPVPAQQHPADYADPFNPVDSKAPSWADPKPGTAPKPEERIAPSWASDPEATTPKRVFPPSTPPARTGPPGWASQPSEPVKPAPVQPPEPVIPSVEPPADSDSDEPLFAWAVPDEPVITGIPIQSLQDAGEVLPASPPEVPVEWGASQQETVVGLSEPLVSMDSVDDDTTVWNVQPEPIPTEIEEEPQAAPVYDFDSPPTWMKSADPFDPFQDEAPAVETPTVDASATNMVVLTPPEPAVQPVPASSPPWAASPQPVYDELANYRQWGAQAVQGDWVLIPDPQGQLTWVHKTALVVNQLPVVQNSPRQYCTATFRVLDPADADTRCREFVQCLSCGALYTRLAWDYLPACARCNGSTCRDIAAPAPAPLPVARKINAISIDRKKAVFDLTTGTTDGKPAARPSSQVKLPKMAFGTALRNLVNAARNGAIALAILAMIVFLSISANGILEKERTDGLSAGSVLNIIFSPGDAASTKMIIATLGAAVLAAWVFYPHVLTDGQGRPSFGRRFVRLLAVIELLALWNVFLVVQYGSPVQIAYRERHKCIIDWEVEQDSIPPPDIEARYGLLDDDIIKVLFKGQGYVTPPTCLAATAEEVVNQWDYAATIDSQLAALALVFLTIPVYRLTARKPGNFVTTRGRTEWLLSLLRFLLVVVGVSGLVVFLVLFQISPALDVQKIAVFSFLGLKVMITFTLVVALLLVAAIGVVLYLPPKHKLFNKGYPKLRFLILVALMVVFGIVYSQYGSDLPEATVNKLLEQVGLLTAVLGLGIIPLQRALS